MIEVVCWYPELGHLMLDTHRALARLADVSAHAVVARTQTAERKRQGWATADISDIASTSLDCPNWWSVGTALFRRMPNALHLFNTMWTDPRFLPLIAWGVARGARIGLITEPYSDEVSGYYGEQSRARGEILKAIRPPIYRGAGLIFGRRVKPVFAISERAVTQFARAGFDQRYIYPYGYFVNGSEPSVTRKSDAALRAIYVGAMLSRKGVDIAANAIGEARTRGTSVTLDIFGSGDATPFLRDGVQYKGTLPAGSAPKTIAEYDLLILPSRYDGWGVVANEALQVGVPVLASRGAGAAAIVRTSGSGETFDPESPAELVACLERVSRTSALLEDWQKKAHAYASRLSPETAARYLRDCIFAFENEHAAPACPWY